MEMFHTDPDVLRASPTLGDPVEGKRLASVLTDALLVPPGMPFFIGDDGSYDLRLSQWTRSLPTSGAPAANTWKAYGRDVLTWARFLREARGKGVWEANEDDLVAYYAARRLVKPPDGKAISSTTWDRGIAALDNLYNYGRRQGWTADLPFHYRTVRYRLASGGFASRQVNSAYELNGDVEGARYLTVPEYRHFRDVGMKGKLLSGADDPRSRLRNAERNALMCQTLAMTGMRLREGGSLTTADLPPKIPGMVQRTQVFRLASAVAKRRRGRRIRLPWRIYRGLHEYLSIERGNAIAVGRGRGIYLTDDWLACKRVGAGRVEMRSGDGGLKVYELRDLDVDERLRLLLVSDTGEPVEPLALWLGEDGGPMALDTWEGIFQSASARCQRLGLDIGATPHTLRHTFAVHMLSRLVEAHAALAREGRRSAYARHLTEPLKKLQSMLGHRHPTTTLRYLDTLAEAQEYLDDAVEQWESLVAESEAA
ncbi:Phage integrase family protein [Geodermatophilus siccatus]|uniref:Phage integrase family protein n=1 Tax=Geodermatophilus siccatus TaxID=1137991 RepID=A0A1G9PUI6_9ACTN|nr:site-specific integrase [Geodermatophilus siccatus]SDM01907.1 Phage integrase family protein [Geodermatophilus siccatus]